MPHRDDDDDLELSLSSQRLDRANHSHDEHKERQRKKLSVLKRAMLLKDVRQNLKPDRADGKQPDAVKTRTHKEREEASIQTADRKITVDTSIEENTQYEAAQREAAGFEEEQAQPS